MPHVLSVDVRVCGVTDLPAVQKDYGNIQKERKT